MLIFIFFLQNSFSYKRRLIFHQRQLYFLNHFFLLLLNRLNCWNSTTLLQFSCLIRILHFVEKIQKILRKMMRVFLERIQLFEQFHSSYNELEIPFKVIIHIGNRKFLTNHLAFIFKQISFHTFKTLLKLMTHKLKFLTEIRQIIVNFVVLTINLILQQLKNP